MILEQTTGALAQAETYLARGIWTFVSAALTGASAPVAGPGEAVISSAYVRNHAALTPSANNPILVKSKNSVVIR